MEPPKKFIIRVLEFCFMLALSAFLINIAAHWIMEVWQVLIAIAIIIIVAIAIYRIWKRRKDSGQW